MFKILYLTPLTTFTPPPMSSTPLSPRKIAAAAPPAAAINKAGNQPGPATGTGMSHERIDALRRRRATPPDSLIHLIH